MGLKEKDGERRSGRVVCAVRTAGDSSHGKARRDLAIICTFGDARVSGIDGPCRRAWRC